MIMIQNTIFQYVLTLFDESRDGELTVGNDDDRFDCSVAWDEETAENLAQQCSALVAHLTELACQYDKLKTETRHLTREQMDVWNTYLKPFPKHGLDVEALQAIWKKFETGEPVTDEEQALADQYVNWFEENALTRLPHKCCNPALMINRAKRYCKLVRLNAPESVPENEAKRFAEEFVLYHCMK
jgi:hypothetical protein